MVKEFFSRIFRGAEPSSPELAPEVRRVQLIHTQDIGTTGTKVFAGYPREEYLNTLLGTQRADIFDQMRRSDPQLKMCLAASKSPLKSAMWAIEPYDQDDEESKKDAELVEFILMRGMEKSWGQFLHEALGILDFGHSVFEMIDKPVMHPELGLISGLRDLAWRSQRTIQRFNVNSDTGKLASVTQWSNGDLFKYVDIPAEFLLVFSLDKEGSNYEGISALRCCYGNFYRKDVYMKLNAIGIEKFAVPTPIADIPTGLESGDQFTNLQAVLEAYISHEKGYITKPAGWEINLHSNAYDPQKVEVSIDNEDKRMVKAFMANFLELGINGFGSQSLSFDLSDFFLGSIEHIGKIICDEINRVLIPRLVEMNRGPRKGYPKLCVSGISDRVGKELAETLKIFADGKIITPDDELEDYVRERYQLPEKSELGQREVNPPQAFGDPANPAKDANPTKEEATPKLSEKVRSLIVRG